jgi:hypothetical protein
MENNNDKNVPPPPDRIQKAIFDLGNWLDGQMENLDQIDLEYHDGPVMILSREYDSGYESDEELCKEIFLYGTRKRFTRNVWTFMRIA